MNLSGAITMSAIVIIAVFGGVIVANTSAPQSIYFFILTALALGVLVSNIRRAE